MSNIGLESLVPASDKRLAELLSGLEAAGESVLVVANAYSARIARRNSAGVWTDVGRGDFGLRCGVVARALAESGRLTWCEVQGTPSAADLSANGAVMVNAGFVDDWLATADTLTGTDGRGSPPRKEDLQYLGYQAGWRCQFSGCGKDLQREHLSGTPGNFSYFAHIVASSSKGPRGDRLLSSVRADDIQNIMLMCDECHRRIDRVDPERFSVDVLNKMRQDSINEVKRLLDTLQYEEAVPLVIMGNITAQSPRFLQRDADEAMWTRRLRSANTGPEHYFYNGGRLHDPHATYYWGAIFDSMADDVPLLRKRLNGTLKADGTRMPVAVFPLHGTSLLVLAGRIVGEGSRVTVFQYNRDRPSGLPGGPWAFDSQVPPSQTKYTVIERASHRGENEACLIVSLTFKLNPERLPQALYSDGVFKVGAIEVTARDSADLRHCVFAHPLDLDYFALALEQAIRTLQDQWRVSTVHLFIGAPASACFTLGQKLQARNHAAVICYESKPGPNAPFAPTILIRNTSVQELQTNQSIALT